MSLFEDNFRHIVVPDLRRACRVQALALARGRGGFEDAHRAVMAQAVNRGALHLSNPVLMDLEAWVDATILKTVADIENRPETAPREIVDETLGAMWATTA